LENRQSHESVHTFGFLVVKLDSKYEAKISFSGDEEGRKLRTFVDRCITAGIISEKLENGDVALHWEINKIEFVH
jgi:transposase